MASTKQPVKVLSGAMRFSQILSLPFPWMGGAYLCCYVLLEEISYVHPFGSFGITPWNPSTGLSFVIALLQGRKALPLLFLAPPLAEIVVRGLCVPVWITLAEAVVVGGGYAAAMLFLLRPPLAFAPSLRSLRDVSLLMATAVVSSALVASCYVSLLVAVGLLQTGDFWPAALRYWVGDMIGIAIVAPFGLLVVTSDHPIRFEWWTGLQIATIILALAVAVASAQNHQLPLFYLLFLPINWIAVSSGLEGVSLALMVTQTALFGVLQLAPERVIDITNLQARMLVVAVTGLVAGALVTERRRAEEELRQKQAAIARLSRLGSMGELAAAIAHEVNQPLSAAGTYARLLRESLAGERLKDPAVIELAAKTAAQVERAADVIRRLRALVRLGRSERSPVAVGQMVRDAVDLVRPVLERNAIVLNVDIDGAAPPVVADRVQIGQVLVNLLRNAAEAIPDQPGGEKRILLRAVRTGAQTMEISVHDSGPGFSPEFGGSAPPLLSTTKADGLGVGLALCRSIVEAHGGSLRIQPGGGGVGATVRFTLPFVRETDRRETDLQKTDFQDTH